MRAASHSAAYRIAGISTSNTGRLKYLRYCPSCVLEDRRLFGECYWHRIHQIFGVEVCEEHSLFLQNSTVNIRSQASRELITAEKAVTTAMAAVGLDNESADHFALLNIAKDVRWLLDQNNLNTGFGALRACYHNILSGKDFARRTRIFLNNLSESFFNHYSSDLLDLLQCNQDELNASNWLFSLLNSLNYNKAVYPLRHLLLIQFLGHSAKSFFELTLKKKLISPLTQENPFGSGPWPCLNPASDHFQELRISKCSIIYKGKQSIPNGTFSCSCGFVYFRRRVDRSTNGLFSNPWVSRFGHVWEEALRNLWSEASLSCGEIAKRLGVSNGTVKYQAACLGLTFPRVGPNGTITDIDPILQEHLKKRYEDKSKKKSVYRDSWLIILKENPTANRSSLERKFGRIFSWLKKNDKEWLQNNLPYPVRKKPTPVRVVDWTERDIRLSQEIKNIALLLSSAAGRPVRITKAAIQKRLETPIQLRKKYLINLPLTVAAFAEVTESFTDFAIRRINWAANCLREDQTSPTRTVLMTRAGVWPIKHIKEVSTAIDAALISLKETHAQASSQAA